MIIMDLKGGSWVGDMYQKFEAMCDEVEEVMYEDTLKYVENQVRTVGETVKKFYSEVIQDLLPPSPSNSMKSEDALSSVFHHNEAKISKKAKILDNGSEKLVKDSGVASCSPIFSVIKPCRPMSICSGVEKSCKENSWSQDTEIKLSNKSSSEAKHPKSLKDSEEKCLSNLPSIEKKTSTFCGLASIESHNTSDELTSVNEDMQGTCRDMMECGDADKVKKMRNLSSGPNTTHLGLSATEAHLITTFTRSVDTTIQVDKELTTFGTETSNPFVATECRKCECQQGFLVEKPNELKLGESCVLVEKNDSFPKSNLPSVQKSYKKKIQDVLSPRRWSKSKREKEELSDWYDEQCGKSSVSTSNMIQEEPRKSLMSESFESDWELL